MRRARNYAPVHAEVIRLEVGSRCDASSVTLFDASHNNRRILFRCYSDPINKSDLATTVADKLNIPTKHALGRGPFEDRATVRCQTPNPPVQIQGSGALGPRPRA